MARSGREAHALTCRVPAACSPRTFCADDGEEVSAARALAPDSTLGEGARRPSACAAARRARHVVPPSLWNSCSRLGCPAAVHTSAACSGSAAAVCEAAAPAQLPAGWAGPPASAILRAHGACCCCARGSRLVWGVGARAAQDEDEEEDDDSDDDGEAVRRSRLLSSSAHAPKQGLPSPRRSHTPSPAQAARPRWLPPPRHFVRAAHPPTPVSQPPRRAPAPRLIVRSVT